MLRRVLFSRRAQIGESRGTLQVKPDANNNAWAFWKRKKTDRRRLESWSRIIQEELPEEEVNPPRNEGHDRQDEKRLQTHESSSFRDPPPALQQQFPFRRPEVAHSALAHRAMSSKMACYCHGVRRAPRGFDRCGGRKRTKATRRAAPLRPGSGARTRGCCGPQG